MRRISRSWAGLRLLEPAARTKSVSGSGGSWRPLREIVLSLPIEVGEFALRYDLTAARPPRRAVMRAPPHGRGKLTGNVRAWRAGGSGPRPGAGRGLRAGGRG